MSRKGDRRPTPRRKRSEVLEEYPTETTGPQIGFTVMALAGLAILGLGVLIAWLMSGPEFGTSPTHHQAASDPTDPVAQGEPEPGAGLTVRPAERPDGSEERVARALPVDPALVFETPPDEESPSVPRAIPVTDATASPTPSEPLVTAPSQVDVRLESGENLAVQREVLRRIDAMPNLTSDAKDKLYAHVNRTRGMGRLATVHFAVGQTRVDPDMITRLQTVLDQSHTRSFADDPTVVFVVLGYADASGDPANNLRISLQRAEAVTTALRELGVQNLMHAVGMGGSNFLDPSQAAKNRAAELWAVLP